MKITINRNPYLNQFQNAHIELESENELLLLTAALEEKMKSIESDNERDLIYKMIETIKQGESNN